MAAGFSLGAELTLGDIAPASGCAPMPQPRGYGTMMLLIATLPAPRQAAHSASQWRASTASPELVTRMDERRRDDDLAEARVLLSRCFPIGGLVLEHRLCLAKPR